MPDQLRHDHLADAARDHAGQKRADSGFRRALSLARCLIALDRAIEFRDRTDRPVRSGGGAINVGGRICVARHLASQQYLAELDHKQRIGRLEPRLIHIVREQRADNPDRDGNEDKRYRGAKIDQAPGGINRRNPRGTRRLR